MKPAIIPMKIITTQTMTTAYSTTARMAAAIAGFALVAASFGSLAPIAKAQTSLTDLQAQVQALIAQLTALQSGSQATASMTFTRDLTIGSSGADVTALQNWLITRGHSIPAGATGYFGAQTRTALAAYQSANGIVPAAGYFGPVTRAKVVATGGTTTPKPDDSGSNSSGLKGGEASLERLRVNDGEDSDLEEGGTAEIAEIQFNVKDGDVRLNRLDLTFVPEAGNSEDEPWKAFDTVRLLADGKEIAEADVSDEDDWLDEDEPYVFRFANIAHVIRENKTAKITVEIEAQNGVVDSGTSDSWTLYVDTNGIRAVDSEGIQQYIGNASQTVSFDLVEEGDGEELTVRTSSEDPNASTLAVEDDKRSTWYTVFAFDLEAEENDIELDRLPIDFTTGTSDADDVIDDVRLKIDGKTFDDFDWNGSGTFASTTFDIDRDATIDEGDRIEVTVEVRFKAANGVNYAPGETIQASVRGENIKAEGADDLVGDGNATGDTHTLQISGINVERTNRSAVATSADGADNDYATYTIEVDVTAFEQDVFIPQSAVDAFSYQIEKASDGTIVAAATATSSSLSSNASTQGNYYRVSEGQTKKFTFTATFNPLDTDESQSYRMQLLGINFAGSATTPDQAWAAYPQGVYETQPVYIND